jgi:tellurite methyltransferase
MRVLSNHQNPNPSQWLVDNIDLLPVQGKALDVAMGNGRNAIYLAKKGLEVEGIDISEDAVASALELAKDNGVNIAASVADLENGYRLTENGYDIIICFNYLHRPLIEQIKDALKPCGFIVYETYIIDQAIFGKPRNPEHLLRHNELLDMFRDFRVLRYREGIIEESKAMASLVAQKVRDP